MLISITMKYVFILIIVLLFALMPELLTAQPPDFPGEPDQVPIDGGLAVLAAGGAAYAVNKLRSKKD